MIDDSDAIAVTGLAIRVPGAADRHGYWANLLAGVPTLSRVEQPPPEGHGTWVPVKGCLAGADLFDAEFFGYAPREAQLTDPQQRVFLELAWHALEDAGHTPATAGRTGVFASATQSRYARLFSYADSGVDELAARIGTDTDFLATRAAYKMDLRGPAVTVQSACSSSLTAVHLAVTALLSGDCDTAIAGGVCITLPLAGGYWHQTGSILSPDGVCRPFDADAAGTVPGNGAGAVVLRRLPQALADGDDIYAVLIGSALSNDGSDKIGFTAPSADGQYAAISRALALAGVDPDRVGMVETHGTGTPLGDPIEVAALRRAYGRRARADGTWCALSAAKSHIGHLDAAAGIAGFITAVLAVHDGVVPPVAGWRAPNPRLQLDDSPLRVSARPQPWPVPGQRVAAVSSFGVGGTNAHVVLAQTPDIARMAPPAGPVPLWLTARTAADLDALAEQLAEYLAGHPEVELYDVGYTLAVGRVPLPLSRTVHGGDREPAIAALRAERSAGPATAPPVFPVPGRRVHLPGYPFQRQRHWADQPAAGEAASEAAQSGLTGLRAAFEQVLGRPVNGDQDSFFDLGGDSLMAVQLLARVEETTGVEPDLADFFDDPTVAGLAAQLSTVGSDAPPAGR